MNDVGAEVELHLGLPSPEELVPLTQTLIPPALAELFFCRNIQFPTNPPAPQYCPEESAVITNDDDEEDADKTAPRTLKRPRLVWTPQLHRRFVEAVHQLGVKNAVPKSIMQIMNVDGLTRENVASHLQKYRLYLKRLHHHHHHHHHLPASGSPFIFPFPTPSPPTISSSSSANLTLIPQQPPQFLPFFSTKGH